MISIMDEFRVGKKSLELCCYVAGAGAFGVFLRWLQVQLAFNELGLPDPSSLHAVVLLFIAASAAVFYNFIRRFGKERMYLPDEFPLAFSNKGRIYQIVRIAAGVILCIGAILLFMKSDTDKNSTDYRVLALLGLLSGAAFPIWLSSANRDPQPNAWLLCGLAFIPMVWLAAWMVICYKLNTINSVVWSFIIELGAVAVSMFAFFRLGGYVFGRPKWKHCLFFCMFSAMLCIMALADERYLGMQVMLLAIALENLCCCWIIVQNLEQREAPARAPRKETTGGFEELT